MTPREALAIHVLVLAGVAILVGFLVDATHDPKPEECENLYWRTQEGAKCLVIGPEELDRIHRLYELDEDIALPSVTCPENLRELRGLGIDRRAAMTIIETGVDAFYKEKIGMTFREFCREAFKDTSNQ